jgi:hypothetical protein
VLKSFIPHSSASVIPTVVREISSFIPVIIIHKLSCRTRFMAGRSHQLCTLLVRALFLLQSIVPQRFTDAVPPFLVG